MLLTTEIQSNRLHPRDAGMVQYTDIYQCNTLYKQTQRKKMVISDADKAFHKIQDPFMLKVLERSGIQGPYLKHNKSNIQQTNSQHQIKRRET